MLSLRVIGIGAIGVIAAIGSIGDVSHSFLLYTL